MDQQFYYDAIDRMEQAGVDREYIQGWVAGYMQNPKREEQRLTDAYEAGFAHGESREANAFDGWKAS